MLLSSQTCAIGVHVNMGASDCNTSSVDSHGNSEVLRQGVGGEPIQDDKARAAFGATLSRESQATAA